MLPRGAGLLFLIPTLLNGQGSVSIGSWNSLSARLPLANNWSTGAEAQVRSLQFYNDFHYHEAKAWVSKEWQKKYRLTLGSGYYVTYQAGGDFVSPANVRDFRVWPQFELFHPGRIWRLEHRLRTEFRFTNLGFRNRFRYRLALSCKLPAIPALRLQVSNEVFFGKLDFLDRNRISGNAQWAFSPQFSATLGYMYQFDKSVNDETGRDFLMLGALFHIQRRPKTSS
jgi:hypothetical protein